MHCLPCQVSLCCRTWRAWASPRSLSGRRCPRVPMTITRDLRDAKSFVDHRKGTRRTLPSRGVFAWSHGHFVSARSCLASCSGTRARAGSSGYSIHRPRRGSGRRADICLFAPSAGWDGQASAAVRALRMAWWLICIPLWRRGTLTMDQTWHAQLRTTA